MAKFSYGVDIGEYNADVRVSVSFESKVEVSKEDYDTLRQAFDQIETLGWKYKKLADSPPDKDIKDFDEGSQ